MKQAVLGVLILLTPAIPAAIAVWLGIGDGLRVSEKPSEYIGVTYSILAASLFAIVAIVGDPSMLMTGGWKDAWTDARNIQHRLLRLLNLFVLYLLVLGLLVVTEIVDFSETESWYGLFDVFGFLVVYSFIWSLWLPFEIRNILITRLEHEIRARRERGRSETSP